MTLAFGIPFVLVHIFPPKDPTTSIEGVSPSPSLLTSSLTSKVGGGRRSNKAEFASSSADYFFSGESPTEPLTTFTDFEGLATQNKSLIRSVSLSNLMLDAASFSSSLEGCLNLQEITLQNIWLVGNFSRVYLPKLLSFTYVQNGNDKRDSYKTPESLKTTLFFDKNEDRNSTWSVEQDLLNLGVDISISKAGTKLMEIRRNEGEIFLNVKYCQSMLINVKGSFDKLTLVNCNVTSESIPVIPPTLKYLNLRNSLPPTDPLSQLLRKQTQLEEFYGWLTFHCEWAGYELFVNISDFPPTIKNFGLNNADWSFSPGGRSSSIKELTVGDFMTESMISSGLPQVFQNLERINIVNVSDPSSASSYGIIGQAIKMKVREIAVVNLHRDFSTMTDNLQEVLEVESVLNQAGISYEMTSCFILQRNDVGAGASEEHYIGRELSVAERHEIRYRGLGFDKVDSLDDYIKWDSLQ
ncbi:unnamed protein product [Orchesella dallaii]|uniref:Uncharacterized protein n=1 Tax=Orchesella dallaii TaxID=48710 RepID=A0ABP1Q3X8_9HEXA